MRNEELGTRCEGQTASIALRSDLPPSLFRLPPSPFAPRSARPAFTLIELLISILIISILAAALLGVAAVASESAREAKTRNIVSRLHTLLMEHYDTYKSRRVKLRESTSIVPGVELVIDNALPTEPGKPGYSSTTPARNRAAFAEARLYALREMMLMEVPDRWSDVVLGDPNILNNPAAMFPDPLYLPARTELSNLYLRQYRSLLTRKNTLTSSTNTVADILKNQSAECLYMIIMNATGDGEAKSLFQESTIGDTDGDGAPEFLDGWGHPISFLRWAPGFASDVQLNLNDLNNTSVFSATDANVAVAKDHDPFDLFHMEPIAFRLVPLIYSAGRDEATGLFADDGYVAWRNLGGANPTVNTGTNNPPYLSPRLTPYIKGSHPANATDYLGSIDPADTKAATDNIHNHLIGTR
jgi:prepilin-type N-terminal cleavage/methylation domain-containing protein